LSHKSTFYFEDVTDVKDVAGREGGGGRGRGTCMGEHGTWGRGTWETCKGRGRRGKAQKTARSGPKTAPQSRMEQDEGGKFSLFRCPPSGTRIPRDVIAAGCQSLSVSFWIALQLG